MIQLTGQAARCVSAITALLRLPAQHLIQKTMCFKETTQYPWAFSGKNGSKPSWILRKAL
jgi:hypothetical protein